MKTWIRWLHTIRDSDVDALKLGPNPALSDITNGLLAVCTLQAAAHRLFTTLQNVWRKERADMAERTHRVREKRRSGDRLMDQCAICDTYIHHKPYGHVYTSELEDGTSVTVSKGRNVPSRISRDNPDVLLPLSSSAVAVLVDPRTS